MLWEKEKASEIRRGSTQVKLFVYIHIAEIRKKEKKKELASHTQRAHTQTHPFLFLAALLASFSIVVDFCIYNTHVCFFSF
jgi:hypothetical protein